MAYKTHWEPTGVVWTYHGTVSDGDVLESNREVNEDPRFGSIRYQIVDLRAVERFAASGTTVREVSRTDIDLSEAHPHIRVAMVADTDLTRGIAAMYQRACGDESWDVGVFDTIEDARAWLKD